MLKDWTIYVRDEKELLTGKRKAIVDLFDVTFDEATSIGHAIVARLGSAFVFDVLPYVEDVA